MWSCRIVNKSYSERFPLTEAEKRKSAMILQWVNGLLGEDLKLIIQLSLGDFYCRLVDLFFDGVVPLERFKPHTDFRENLYHLQAALEVLQIPLNVPVKDICSLNFRAGFDFACEFYKTFEDISDNWRRRQANTNHSVEPFASELGYETLDDPQTSNGHKIVKKGEAVEDVASSSKQELSADAGVDTPTGSDDTAEDATSSKTKPSANDDPQTPNGHNIVMKGEAVEDVASSSKQELSADVGVDTPTGSDDAAEDATSSKKKPSANDADETPKGSDPPGLDKDDEDKDEDEDEDSDKDFNEDSDEDEDKDTDEERIVVIQRPDECGTQ